VAGQRIYQNVDIARGKIQCWPLVKLQGTMISKSTTNLALPTALCSCQKLIPLAVRPCRTFQVQKRQKPLRCQATSVSGSTMASAERQ
jgi:hypothetical protein